MRGPFAGCFLVALLVSACESDFSDVPLPAGTGGSGGSDASSATGGDSQADSGDVSTRDGDQDAPDVPKDTAPLDVDLTDTGLSDTDLSDTGLSDTGLSDTDLSDIDLTDTGLPDTGLTDTDLPDTGLTDTGLTDTDPSDGPDSGPDVLDTGADTEEAGCEPGTADCDDEPGCETPTSQDLSNCGECNRQCGSVARGEPVCVDGECEIDCHTGYGNCDGVYDNGCELNVTSDVANCGECNKECPFHDNGTPSCVSGQCKLQCNSGWGDCDFDPDTGCETDLMSLSDCGQCDNQCSASPHAAPVCAEQEGDYQCSWNCEDGYGDCNGSDGCETPLGTLEHCGVCGVSCGTTHASPVCTDGTCVLNCDAGYGDCDADSGNGCESSLTTEQHCGECGRDCLGTSCISGMCEPQELASGMNVVSLALGESDVYVATSTGVHRVSKTGNDAVEIYPGESTIVDAVADPTHLFWIAGLTDWDLRKAPLNPGVPDTFAEGALDARCLTQDEEYLYFLEFSAWIESAIYHRVRKSDGENWTSTGHFYLSKIAVDADSAFLAINEPGHSRLERVPKGADGSPAEVVETGTVVELKVDSAHVYWIDDGTDYSLRKAPKEGGSFGSLLSGVVSLNHIALDEEYVYVTRGNPAAGGEVLRVSKDGGPPLSYNYSMAPPILVAVDEESIYWTTVNKVMRVSK